MYCTNCGQQFEEDSSFCPSCGKSKPTDIFPKVSFFKALELGYRRAPDFRGRSRRSEYWWWVLFTTSINILLGWIPIIGILITLLLLIPTISLTTRRLHDINLSGWWQAPIQGLGITVLFLPQSSLPGLMSLILTLMILGCLCIFIYWTAKDGDKNPNNYGDSPKFPKTKDINQNI